MNFAADRICRICMCGADDGDDRPLVAKCSCRGSAKYVHADCLERWRRTSSNSEDAYRCNQCKDHYRDELSLELLRARLKEQRADSSSSGEAGDLWHTTHTLGVELRQQGLFEDAESCLRKALALARAFAGDREQCTLVSVSSLARLCQEQGNLSEAEALHREALDARRATLGDQHPSTLISISNMAVLLQAQGRLDEAEPLFLEDLAASRATLGPRHASTLTAVNNMASLHKARGRLDEAAVLLRDNLAMRRQTLGDRHPQTCAAVNNLAALLQDQGRLAEAEALYREAWRTKRSTLGAHHPDTLVTAVGLGSVLLAQAAAAQAAAAQAAAAQAEAAEEAAEGTEAVQAVAVQAVAVQAVAVQAEAVQAAAVQAEEARRGLDAAEALLSDTATASAACLAAGHRTRLRATALLAELHRVRGCPARARQLLDAQLLATARSALGPAVDTTLALEAFDARLRCAEERHSGSGGRGCDDGTGSGGGEGEGGGLQSLREVLSRMRESLGPGNPETRRCEMALAEEEAQASCSAKRSKRMPTSDCRDNT